MFAAPTADDFAALETFLVERGAPVDHEVSPLADPATLTLGCVLPRTAAVTSP